MSTDANTPQYRSLADLGADVQLRSGGDGRTLSGIAVPWDRPTQIRRSLRESFARDAFRSQTKDPGRIPLAREHLPLGGALIGRVTMLRNDAAGLYAEARIARTAAGDETLALLEDGALDSLSIGFREGQNRRLQDGTIERRTATMTELAVVLRPAIVESKVLALRSEDECPHCGHYEDTEHQHRSNSEQLEQILAGIPSLPAIPRGRSVA